MLKVACFLAVLLPTIASAVDYQWPVNYTWPEVKREPVRWVAFMTQKGCGPCIKEVNEELPKLKKKGWIIDKWGQKATLAIVDIHEFPAVSEKFDIDVTPTFLLFEDDKLLNTKVGFQTAETILEWSEKWKPEPKSSVRLGYPIRKVNWTGPDGKHQLASKSEAIEHLLFDGTHVGKFTRKQLENLSLESLRALHSDDHENRIKWQFLRN